MNERDCPHGHLRRECTICDTDDYIATLEAKIARLRKGIKAALSGNNARHHFPALVEWRDLREALHDTADD
jgi:hypothetical protein